MASGRAYRVESPPASALVTPQLASELQRVLERFAVEAGFAPTRPVGVFFKPGVVGHHQVGRAADIYAVDGVSIARWKQLWDAASPAPCPPGTAPARHAAAAQRHRNTGWRLYTALQRYGRWSQPYGYPIQLFGPWTRAQGPWRHISDRLLYAHRDHVHVAL